jgi:Flp pilus assembly protein TadG
MRQRVMTAMTSSMPRAFRRFGRDRRGVSAVEFAFIAPVMIGLYLGCVEISDGVAADRKVSLVSAALANLTASCNSSNANAGSCANNIISTTEMNNILDASSAIIAPYDAAKLKMTVSCLSVDANKNVTVKWSVTRNGTAQSGAVTIPAALAAVQGTLIYSTVSYDYKPIVGYTITGTLTLSDNMYSSPRTQAPSYPDAAHPCG